MSNERQAVILIHGLWMKPWTWFSFHQYLRDKGYHVYRFGYKTSRQSFDLSQHQLEAFVNSRPEPTVHMVGHSMGGLLALKASQNIRKTGRLVMLASPINGSKVAKHISQTPFLKKLLKFAETPLIEGIKITQTDRPTMMIMGNWPIGLGRIFYRFKEPSDGTVAVASTQADWLDKHQVINSNHLGILKNKQAKLLTWQFIKESDHD